MFPKKKKNKKNIQFLTSSQLPQVATKTSTLGSLAQKNSHENAGDQRAGHDLNGAGVILPSFQHRISIGKMGFK